METSAVNLREYTKIFTGTNQEIGYETPFFSFITDTTNLILKQDTITYFHYPINAPSALLIDSSLLIDGAVAGNSPYTSDKIWKKQANYASNTFWGNSQPIGKQTGVWLCAWLSGNALDTNSVWKDRWYNPGYINQHDALYITNPVASSIIIDIDSEISFDGGCYYKYFHVGNIHNNNITNALSSGNHLKLYLEDWSETPIDISNNNTSKIIGFTNNCVNYQGINYLDNPSDTCLNLNKTNYCETMYSSSISLTGELSYNIWAQSNDWTTGNNTLLSKNNRGGYSLKIDQGFDTSLMVFFDNNGKTTILNRDGLPIISKTLPTYSNPTSVAIDSNHFIWVADNLAKCVYKIDYNGDILNSIKFDNSVNLNSITLDDDKLLWVLDSNTNSVSSFDIFTTALSTSNTICSISLQSIQNISIDLNNNLQSTSGTQIVIDNDNIIWSVNNNKIYKNSTFIMSGDVIACDKDNNMWVLFDSNSYLKMDTTTFAYVSGTIGDNTILTNRSINFTYELNNNYWTQFVYFTFENEQKSYKTDLNGTLVNTIDLSIFNIYPKLDTFTAYDWNRKFNYIKYNKTPQIKAEIFVNNNSTFKKYTLSTPVCGFNDKNWHMFTYTYDKNNLMLYMDSILRDLYTIGNDTQIYYNYENSLLIGTDIGKIEPFEKELNLTVNYFNGKIDSIRIYDNILNNMDIQHLYLNKFKYNDLNWNIPTGKQNYIEEIVRFFKFKLPGQKSQYYNINLIGLQITDINVRIIIENIIRDTIKKIVPAYTELYKIVWK